MSLNPESPENDYEISGSETESEIETGSSAEAESLQDNDLPHEDTATDDLLSGDLDIDAALAAVGSLSEVIEEQQAAEAEERRRLARIEAEDRARQAVLEVERQRELEEQQRAEEEYQRWVANYDFKRPPLVQLQRGRLASLVPALILMAVGVYLTFLQTLAPEPAEPVFILLIVAAGIGLTLIAYWLASRRWARGAFFLGVTILLSGGLIYFLTVFSTVGIVTGWPLILVAVAVAMFLAALMCRPTLRQVIPLALALAAGGGFMLAANLDLLPPDIAVGIADVIGQTWPVVLVAALVLMLLPVVLRRRT